MKSFYSTMPLLGLTIFVLVGNLLGQPSLYSDVSDLLVWKFSTGKEIYATPLVHNGTVYIGSLDKYFYAIDSQTGGEKWKYETGNPIQSNAAISDSIVCFESGNQLYGLNLSGDLQWKFSLSNGNVINMRDSWDFTHSSPDIVEGVAYIGTEEGLVFGIDIRTGEKKFECQTNTKSVIRIQPLIHENKLFVGDWIGVLSAFDFNSGDLLWEYDTRTDNTYSWTNAITTPLRIQGNSLFFAGRSCNAYSINIENGSRNWKFNDPSVWIVGGTTISDNVVYFGSSNQRKVFALDVTTGESHWIGKVDHRCWTMPLVSGDNVIVGAGSVLAYNKQTGDKVNSIYFDPDNVHPNGCIVSWNGSVTHDKNDALANIHSSPVLSDNHIIFGCDDGNLYAVNYEKFVNKQLPDINFKDDEEVRLGIIPRDGGDYEFPLMIYNSGSGKDILDIECSGAAKVKNSLTITSEELTVAGNDSIAISIGINPRDLDLREHKFTVSVTSYLGLVNVIQKDMYFTVTESAGISESAESNIPIQFILNQNYPNPFNPDTKIKYNLQQSAHILLKIVNLAGQEIENLVDGFQTAGEHEIRWQSNDLPCGIYFYRLQAGEFSVTKKLILQK